MSATQETARDGGTSRNDHILRWQIAVGVAAAGRHGKRRARLHGSQWTSRAEPDRRRAAQWAQGKLYLHIATTLTEVVTGLVASVAAFGVLAGLVLGRSPLLSVILRPIIVAFYSVPLIALAPLFIMFFGLDMLPKIVLVTTRRVLPAVLQHVRWRHRRWITI